MIDGRCGDKLAIRKPGESEQHHANTDQAKTGMSGKQKGKHIVLLSTRTNPRNTVGHTQNERSSKTICAQLRSGFLPLAVETGLFPFSPGGGQKVNNNANTSQTCV